MSTLSWNEIRTRATTFAKEWENESSEDAEAKSFWDGFFDVFGVPRKRVATFEEAVKKNGDKQGFIDLLWKGVILVEHKSRGRDLDKAFTQAKDYFPGLSDADLPRYILVSDFARFRLYDLELGTREEFLLAELPQRADIFGFIAGYQKRVFTAEDPVNIRAAELMGKLHDSLRDIGYTGHDLEVYLVRILFCLFAEDTSIFDRKLFQEYIETRTSSDGSDLAYHLDALFDTLNTHPDNRLRNIDESLGSFPYVNGQLFAERLRVASFDQLMRERLLTCCRLDWSGISPAIFGSLFQNVMDDKARHNLGAHYTSETNIMKLISPLFLDDLWAEFHSVKSDKKKLEVFHSKLASLTFLDPACGCGNFLVITYRELRRLEMAVIQVELGREDRLSLSVGDFVIRVTIDQFYGIEIEEFPSQIAPVAMWLMDHQMNMEIGSLFGQYINTIPLVHRATIVHANALVKDWRELIAPEKLSYIIGNPPFLGHHLQTVEQKADMVNVLQGVSASGVMDFVSAWYYRASEYIQGTKIKVAFVSTNSISQGEQVGILWSVLLEKFHIKIHFAHQTFRWSNDANGNAAVFCIIVGFASYDTTKKKLYLYETIAGDAHEVVVKNINPYLVDAKDVIISNTKKPICAIPAMMRGSQPTDGGNFIMNKNERDAIISAYPIASKYILPYIGAEEFINGGERYCLWLVDADPSEIKSISPIMERVDAVKKFRSESVAATTRDYQYHTLFRQIAQPKSDYILIPRVSSERRSYIPMGFLPKDTITADSCLFVPNATLYHFGILTSQMHMSWVRSTSGRLKSDYRYSKDIVYNNYPWPEVTDKNQAKISELAQAVLDARALFPLASLADLYDPRTMPAALVKAHTELDRAVDRLYRSAGFASDIERVAELFERWERMSGVDIIISP